ncbi:MULTISPECIES: TetR/AcrR family transcriptional regulator [Brachybacterium]|uniref:TetR/AcrR family transcriptional regulator n=2 Tax=Brachybacterium TaxID=43668 RepID=A0A3R8QXE2_9MICO|nr:MULTISPECIES: TetR/AcrR family transcriptional regulator [Brachybacterium]MCT1438336.1 TetR/AcrR family transcriptional regulator [Brachybacterium paraconglomeratum]RRR20055.1 TetR/AcrR family transcriptional regulator [Brachybacterium paraconglomeratum]GLI31909.1 TetR family transcriptional regulator [Brachybacterium conglomeratum]GLK03442.1 TetR family transcriptional regulator [Brachybacterium conglomeratum]
MSSPTTSRMPREQRRSQLLRLATEVFTEKGYQATSMDDIATAAGVTKPVLYQHFRSKETLYVEVLDVIGEAMLVEVRDMAGRGGDAEDRVGLGLRRFYELMALKNSLRLFTGHEIVSDEVKERVTRILDEMSIELAGVLTSYRALSTGQARILGRGLIGIAQTTAQQLHDAAADDEERDEILSTVTAVVVNGLTGFTPVEQTGAGRADADDPAPEQGASRS